MLGVGIVGNALPFTLLAFGEQPPAVASTGQLLCASAVLAPFAVATSVTGGFSPSWARVGAIVALGVFGTGAAYLLNYRIVAEVGATRASLVTYLVPVVAVAVGIVVLDEAFTWRLLAGGLLIVTGIAAVHDRVRVGRRAPPVPAGVASAVVVALAALSVTGCGDGGATGREPTPSTEGAPDDEAAGPAPCRPEVREPLDPASSQHVVGDDDSRIEYLSDPPTSGAHLAGPPLSGVLDEPLSRPRQVGHLEAGGILIQHRDLDAAGVAELAAVAGPEVAVAPNPDLPSPVVATAWLVKQTCDAVDADALSAFVDAHRGRGPGTDG